jgi:hypothetical protein
VDVVVELQSTFHYNTDHLSATERVLFSNKYPGTAEYQLEHFRTDVLATLCAYFGAAAITEGNKCINIAPNGNRLPADVVVCVQYRNYKRIYQRMGYGGVEEEYIPGILFYTRKERRPVINYPKPHYDNGVAKHARTNEWFKPTVRAFKNARSYMVDNGLIKPELAPSYFLQCLLYNARDNAFGRSYQDTFNSVLVSVAEQVMKDKGRQLICQNGQLPLFGDSPEQWCWDNAIQFLSALLDLWNKWK